MIQIQPTSTPIHKWFGRSGGGTESYGYSLNVQAPTRYTNQVGNVTQYGYHAAGWKTNEVMVGISTNQFAYDPAGNLRELRDGKNQLTSWGYNSFGRVATKTNAANAAILAYAYDANSRLTNRWSAAKGNTAYSYDAVGNLTNINYPTSTDLQALDLLKQTVGKWCNRGGGGGNSGGPTFGPSPSVVNNIAWGTVLAGGAIIVGTLAADVFTGGVSIADDPATIAAGIALIGVGLNGGNEMH